LLETGLGFTITKLACALVMTIGDFLHQSVT